MIHEFMSNQGGFEIEADAVVIGSGAGGAISAYNLASAGMKTVLLESGPPAGPAQFTHNAPEFLAKYYWEGGLRLTGGNAAQPMMQGRMLGGSTVVNSAIMYELPDWVKDEWHKDDGVSFLYTDAAKNSVKRIFKQLRVEKTPRKSYGRRNELVEEVFKNCGLTPNPLPRAVVNCEGSGDCLTGCSGQKKQSVDISYIQPALEKGLQVFTSCHVDKILMEGNRATGVTGDVILDEGRTRSGKFRVMAPIVIVAAGATHTPVILQKSGFKKAGKDLQVHITGALFALMAEEVHPWVGASQGVGAFSDDIRGLKYESLWASNSVMSVKWGSFGPDYFKNLRDLKRSLLIAGVYRGKTSGAVSSGLLEPRIKIWVKKKEVQQLFKGLYRLAPGFMKAGAEFVYSGMPGTKAQMKTEEDFRALLNPKLGFSDISSTMNHLFCSCPMTADRKRAVVDFEGRVLGSSNIYVADASLFPSPSAVNPQVTVMMLSDLVSRRVASLKDGDYLEQAGR